MVLGQLTMSSTYDEVAREVVAQCYLRGLSKAQTVPRLSTLIQESGLRPDVWDGTHTTFGIAQQDASYPHRDDPNAQIPAFLDKLAAQERKPGASDDPWLNIAWLQQRPNWPSAQYWLEHGRVNYLAEIKKHTAEATRLTERYWPSGGTVPTVTAAPRPDFNEINQIGWDAADPHGSPRSQPPKNWFIHTQEGDGNAEQLAAYLRSTKGSAAVSYHYTIHEDPNDHGVTVCDVIDTDLYSWAVLNANVFSINACFASSRAAWTRDQWIATMRNAIRVAAYLAVEDAKKYPTISANVILPPYLNPGSGLSDHRYVTQALKIGTHTDVGGPTAPPWNGFPWDLFAADVQSYLGVPTSPTGSAPPPAVDTTPVFSYPATEVMIRETWEQLRGPQAAGWAQLGTDAAGRKRTLVDAVGALVAKEGV